VSAAQILQHARSLGIELTPTDGKLHYEAPAGRLTAELREALTKHKAAILDVLQAERVRENRAGRLARELQERPGDRYCFEVTEADPVIVALAIRTATGIVVGELAIPQDRWDHALFFSALETTSRRPQ